MSHNREVPATEPDDALLGEPAPAAALSIVVAINPAASFGHTSGVGVRVVEALRLDGHEVEQLLAAEFAALQKQARAALAGHPHAFVVVGGDGMVSLAVNLLAETDTPLGIVPTGTGNDFALGLGIPLDAEAALAGLRASLSALAVADGADAARSGSGVAQPSSVLRTIDLGRVTHGGGDVWFASALSAGFDALVNERANHMRRPRGASRYTIALLLELLRLRARTYRLVVDGVQREVASVLLTVANNRSIGGGMLVAPGAVLDDGALDLFIVAPVSRLTFLRLFPKVFKGTHAGLPIVELTRVRSVELDAPDIVAYADGERIGPLPVTVTIVPAALRVLA